MIHYLIQNYTDFLASSNEENLPSGLLSTAEMERWNSFRFEKRRREWLLGRWTAKNLVQEVLLQKTGECLPLNCIEINSASDGAPEISLRAVIHDTYAREVAFSLSISHSHDAAFCALLDKPGWSIGADLERVEKRPPNFSEEYFTSEELARLNELPAELRDPYITVVWSAKEAVVKALRSGLTVETKWVNCRVDLAQRMSAEWSPFTVKLDSVYLGEFPELEGHFCMGWWLPWRDYFVTIAITSFLKTSCPSSTKLDHDYDTRG